MSMRSTQSVLVRVLSILKLSTITSTITYVFFGLSTNTSTRKKYGFEYYEYENQVLKPQPATNIMQIW